ncbi:TadE/TadG family type IV pilus assembly protein [Sphingobium nicotianae]|uniref:Pilus assembly protein n=1 Tax=Sphingobium nicotianae TaxID=2782607 RepID=A0A9X1DBV7_9SPHN|nr:TadE/TadG family type IV pilus assembly protein [Sphingobium nicotianae]MBT2187262.1 pilus assembly protein [Sphingobium nicotianae]
MTRLLASFLRDRRGTAAAEMALVTPLLIIIMFGAFEAGNYFWNEHVLIKAVRDGARFAGRQSFGKYSCAAVTDSAAASAIRAVTRTGSPSGTTPRIAGWTDAQVTLAVSCVSGESGIYAANAGDAPRVTVSATVPYTALFGSLIFANDLNLVASAQSPVMGI